MESIQPDVIPVDGALLGAASPATCWLSRCRSFRQRDGDSAAAQAKEQAQSQPNGWMAEGSEACES